MLCGVLLPSFVIFFDENPQSVGIDVHLLRLGPAKGDITVPLLLLRLEGTGANSAPHLYLNSRSVGWQALSGELNTQLKYRAEWVVHVEADPSLSWRDAVNAMDIIRGAGARAVLLTKVDSSSAATR
jgi:hypothetical protein